VVAEKRRWSLKSGKYSRAVIGEMRKWKGRVKHENVYQAETDVFGPPEDGYQVQFLNELVEQPARAR